MIKFPIPLLGFAAYSGTGKTTLLTKLIPLLANKGIRIAIIKHSHHNIELDNPKKDSYKLRKAGAQQTIIASPKRTSMITEHPNQEDSTLEHALSYLKTDSLDLVLVEGFKFAEIPKIELHRKALNKPYFYPEDQYIIAIAEDDLNKSQNDQLAQLDINKPNEIVTFIENYLRQGKTCETS